MFHSGESVARAVNHSRCPQFRRLGVNPTHRCTDDEKSALYNRLDISGGNTGIVCTDLVAFVEGPVDYDSGVVDSDIGAVTVASRDEERGLGKLLRRAQATIVEAAQVPI